MDKETYEDYRNKTEEVRNISMKISEYVDEITKNSLTEINSLISPYINKIQSNRYISDEELRNMILDIPVVLYNLIEVQENLHIYEDISKVIKQNKFGRYRDEAKGTIQDKNNKAEELCFDDNQVIIIYQRAKNIVKNKINIAIEILNSLKKIYDERFKR